MAAQAKLNAELLKLARDDSPLAGLREDDVEGADGRLRKRSEPTGLRAMNRF